MILLVLGGTRSGKSEVAERVVAATARPVTYLATGRPGGGGADGAGDADFAARIAEHRRRRPADWDTIEAHDDLTGAVRSLALRPGAVLIDAIGPWLAGVPDFAADVAALTAAIVAISQRHEPVVIVSEEVGLGVHASTAVGRAFADALGSVNQSIARIADHVWLVVAGRVLPLLPAELASDLLLGG